MIPSNTKYVVYSIKTGRAIHKSPRSHDLAFYETKGPATRFANRFNELCGFDPAIAVVCTVEEYTNGICPDYTDGKIKMVERVNLMTGKKYMEPANTPNYCSPASESYWTM